ncbi:MAG: PEP-CTERM sorting domain-containing protein [Planctomycetota bacterium]|nr:PEP-CTERM sorting domain-containing protein [Planctomycetota bacterium]
MRRLILLLVLGLMTAPVFGGSIPILTPGDAIIAIDADGIVSSSSYPAGEAPRYAIDGLATTKYLNYGGAGSGFIVTPVGYGGSSTVQSFQLTTANDGASRDPQSYALWGTNAAITSADNSTGLAESWTLISEGGLTRVEVPLTRLTTGPVVNITNISEYMSYKMMFPTNYGSSMFQIGDVALFDSFSSSVLTSTDPIIAVEVGWNSSYPAAEKPSNAIDQTLDTKYLNFGKTNSGFIVTPAIGPSTLDSFQITTAGDATERDPVVWMLYGTNDAITSADNSAGVNETWTLICAGTMFLPEDRLTLGPVYQIANQDQSYTSYKMFFPTVRDEGAANSMQIDEIQFYGIPEPATVALFGLGGLSLLGSRRKH